MRFGFLDVFLDEQNTLYSQSHNESMNQICSHVWTKLILLNLHIYDKNHVLPFYVNKIPVYCIILPCAMMSCICITKRSTIWLYLNNFGHGFWIVRLEIGYTYCFTLSSSSKLFILNISFYIVFCHAMLFSTTWRNVVFNSYQTLNVYPFLLHVQKTYGVSMGITR